MSDVGWSHLNPAGISMLSLLVLSNAACTPAGSEGADALYVGDCDLVDMRRRAVSIVDNADPDFADVRGQYGMTFARRPDTRELVLFRTPRPGTQAETQAGGGYALTFAAETCKFDRLGANT